MPRPTVSVIIPTLNEASFLEAAIASSIREEVDEIIIADGGSHDGTIRIAEKYRTKVVHCQQPQRARQMNLGAAAARGDLLIFLHADSTFQPGAIQALRRIATKSNGIGGGFERLYKTKSLVLKLSCRIGNARAARLGWCFGDQAIWCCRDAFERLGGFPKKSIFEDLDFSRALSTLGTTQLIKPGIKTSARRFRKKTVRRILQDILLTIHHVCLDRKP